MHLISVGVVLFYQETGICGHVDFLKKWKINAGRGKLMWVVDCIPNFLSIL